MSAPIAPFVGAALEPQLVQVSGPTDLIDTVPFDVTLGAAIAGGLLVTLPPVATPSAEPLLELLLEGEWLPDEPAAPAEVCQPALGGPADAPAAAGGEPMILEKNLDSWLAAFGRRERSNPPRGDGESDPHLVRLDEPAVPETVKTSKASEASERPAETADLLTTVPPSIGLSRLWPVEIAGPTPVQPKPPADEGAVDRLGSDLEVVLPHIYRPSEARRSSQPMVEIGGFDFPSLPEAPDPSTLKPALLPTAVPPELIATSPDVGAPAPTAPRGPAPSIDLVDMSNQAAPAVGRLGEVVSRARSERVARVDVTGTWKEPRAIGPNGAEVARAVLHQTGAEPRGDSRTSDRRSQSDRPADAGDVISRRRPGTEPPAFEPGSVVGRGPVAAGSAAGESFKAADPPPLAPSNPLEPIARRIDHLTLDLKDDAGDFGRLRVSVSGPQVRATIMPNDPAMADRLNLEIRQLKVSLQERGFPEPRVTVQAPRAPEPVNWAPVARDVMVDSSAPGQPNTQRRANDDDRRDRWTAGRDQRRDEQRQQEQARQSRRDHPGDPK